MKTLSISISELEYNKFGLPNDKLTFSEFIEIIGKELTRQALDKSIEFAGQYGLSSMTMEEISKEVKAIRRNAKNRA